LLQGSDRSLSLVCSPRVKNEEKNGWRAAKSPTSTLLQERRNKPLRGGRIGYKQGREQPIEHKLQKGASSA